MQVARSVIAPLSVREADSMQWRSEREGTGGKRGEGVWGMGGGGGGGEGGRRRWEGKKFPGIHIDPCTWCARAAGICLAPCDETDSNQPRIEADMMVKKASAKA